MGGSQLHVAIRCDPAAHMPHVASLGRSPGEVQICPTPFTQPTRTLLNLSTVILLGKIRMGTVAQSG
jgi:hypothetical protein